MSRVTLHRIERGEPSVTMGAYLNALAVLGLDFEILARLPSGFHAVCGSAAINPLWFHGCRYSVLRILGLLISESDQFSSGKFCVLSINGNNDAGVGFDSEILSGPGCTFHGSEGTSQIWICGVANVFGVHRLLQSISLGLMPELSYSAQEFTIFCSCCRNDPGQP